MRLVFRRDSISRALLFAIRESNVSSRRREIAAAPSRLQGGANQVTLWDEVAPPAPPVPVDAMPAGGSNASTYRKE